MYLYMYSVHINLYICQQFKLTDQHYYLHSHYLLTGRFLFDRYQLKMAFALFIKCLQLD
jgi:hypothetical protein